MNIIQIQDAIVEKQAALAELEADVQLLARLKAAPGMMKQATAELADLEQQLARANAEALEVAREQRRAAFRNVAISEATNSGLPVLYGITYQEKLYSIHTRQAEWTNVRVEGFTNAGPKLIEYVLEFVPEALPASITNLCPGDPRKAMDIYLAALRRGHFNFVR